MSQDQNCMKKPAMSRLEERECREGTAALEERRESVHLDGESRGEGAGGKVRALPAADQASSL